MGKGNDDQRLSGAHLRVPDESLEWERMEDERPNGDGAEKPHGRHARVDESTVDSNHRVDREKGSRNDGSSGGKHGKIQSLSKDGQREVNSIDLDGLEGKGYTTPRDRGKRGWYVVYAVVVILLLLTPLVSMPFAPNDPEAELQELAPIPNTTIDGHPNYGFLADMGGWFDDHFGFRQQLITVNAHMMAQGFATSPTDQVVVGTQGWLYYGGTMADYQRTAVITPVEAFNAAFNLKLIQEYVENHGGRFLLAVAPNKNSLYPQFMPYYELQGTGASSWDRLQSQLDAQGVNYVDLFTLFKNQDEMLYMKTDTHWNTRGARLAYNAMLDSLGKEHDNFLNAPVTWDNSFVGDLEAMLYPLGRQPEPIEVIDAAQRFSYSNEATSVEDGFITTTSENEGATGSLLMYRDSFGNALLPFFATTFQNAAFSKLVPYDLTDMGEVKTGYVVVERAERHLDFFATTPPILPAPVREGLILGSEVPSESTLEFTENGPYLQVSGVVDAAFPTSDSSIYLVVRDENGGETWYEAFHQSIPSDSATAPADDNGYLLYIENERLQDGALEAALVVSGSDGNVVLASWPLER